MRDSDDDHDEGGGGGAGDEDEGEGAEERKEGAPGEGVVKGEPDKKEAGDGTRCFFFGNPLLNLNLNVL
jgi:hypothetical protein